MNNTNKENEKIYKDCTKKEMRIEVKKLKNHMAMLENGLKSYKEALDYLEKKLNQ